MPNPVRYEHYWTQLNAIEHYWTLLNTIEHYWTLLNTFEHHWTLLNTIEHNWTIDIHECDLTDRGLMQPLAFFCANSNVHLFQCWTPDFPICSNDFCSRFVAFHSIWSCLLPDYQCFIHNISNQLLLIIEFWEDAPCASLL